MLKLVQTFKGNRNSWCVCHNQINTKSKSWINTASIFAKMSICSRKKTDNLCDFGFLSFGHSIVRIAYLSRWLWFLFFFGSSILSTENNDVLNRKKREIRKIDVDTGQWNVLIWRLGCSAASYEWWKKFHVKWPSHYFGKRW